MATDRPINLCGGGIWAAFPIGIGDGYGNLVEVRTETVPWKAIEVEPGIFIYVAVSKTTNKIAILDKGTEK